MVPGGYPGPAARRPATGSAASPGAGTSGSPTRMITLPTDAARLLDGEGLLGPLQREDAGENGLTRPVATSRASTA